MEKHAPRWNGIGYVQSEYEGRTCMSSAMTEANFIIKYMHQDKPGSQMVLHFRYEDYISKFYEMLSLDKSFKKIPSSLYKRESNTELYGDNIDRIECRQARKRKPIEIVKMKPTYSQEQDCEIVTVYVRRITPEEMLKYMSDEVLKFNDMTNDRYKIAWIPGYSERLKAIQQSDKENSIETELESLSDEEIWIEIPGGGRFNRVTGEIEEATTYTLSEGL